MKTFHNSLMQYLFWWIPTTLFLCLLYEWYGVLGIGISAVSLGILGVLFVLRDNNRRIKKAIENLQDYGNDAGHHMQYGIDQTLRDLMGMEAYQDWRTWRALNDYDWDEGVPP